MSRALLVLSSGVIRDRGIDWIKRAPTGTRIEFKGPRRSLDQNSKLWACLSDVASQLSWHGERLTTEEWKFLFLDALKRETKTVRSLDGLGVVNIGRSSSDLSKQEFCDLIEVIMAFGTGHGVIFHDQDSNSLPPPVADQPAARTSPTVAAGNNSERL